MEKAYPELDCGQCYIIHISAAPSERDATVGRRRLAKKQHTVEEAQRCLRQRKHGGDGEAVVAADSEETGYTRQQRSRVLD